MKFLIKIGIVAVVLVLLYLFAEGVVSFDASFKAGGKMFGAAIKAGLRELPRSINITP